MRSADDRSRSVSTSKRSAAARVSFLVGIDGSVGIITSSMPGRGTLPRSGRERADNRSLRRARSRSQTSGAYSHSTVAGGFEVISYATRFTPGTSLTIRVLMRSSNACGNRAQSAVMPSSLVIARTATKFA